MTKENSSEKRNMQKKTERKTGSHDWDNIK